MNITQKHKWNKIRENGKFRFILKGIIFWGLTGMLLSTLLDYGFEFFLNDKPRYLHTSENFIFKILLRLFLSCLIGFFINRDLWNKNESKFFQNVEEK